MYDADQFLIVVLELGMWVTKLIAGFALGGVAGFVGSVAPAMVPAILAVAAAWVIVDVVQVTREQSA